MRLGSGGDPGSVVVVAGLEPTGSLDMALAAGWPLVETVPPVRWFLDGQSGRTRAQRGRCQVAVLLEVTVLALCQERAAKAHPSFASRCGYGSGSRRMDSGSAADSADQSAAGRGGGLD